MTEIAKMSGPVTRKSPILEHSFISHEFDHFSFENEFIHTLIMISSLTIKYSIGLGVIESYYGGRLGNAVDGWQEVNLPPPLFCAIFAQT